ncbi:MAG TPA: DUF1922 domain-containing protein [Methanocorpusculum sp.]|nr:DUF1922 domain-containing protein [Methanocorpusculum sp.]
MIREGFGVIGCPRCRRMQVADLTHATKTCICGHKIDLTKTKLLAVSDSADEAGAVLRSFTAPKNSGFVSAARMYSSSPAEKTLKKDND